MNSEELLNMLSLLELEQLVAFADWGRLSKAAFTNLVNNVMLHLE